MTVEPFIKCSSVAASMIFYTEVLDFDALQRPHPDPGEFMSKYGMIGRQGSLVHLSAHADDGVFGSVILIRVADLSGVYAGLQARGLREAPDDRSVGISMQPVDQSWGVREFSVRDLDGNRITFAQSLA